jgi:hypothetical protein
MMREQHLDLLKRAIAANLDARHEHDKRQERANPNEARNKVFQRPDHTWRTSASLRRMGRGEDYQNAPPLQAIALAEKMPGVQLHLKVDEEALEDIEYLIAAPMDGCPEVGGLVVWARDHRTYRLIVQRLGGPDRIRLQ